MKKVSMLTVGILFFCFMFTAPEARAARQAESCSGNCSANIGGSQITGNPCWTAYVHDDHTENNRCSNFFIDPLGHAYLTDGEGGEGTCSFTYYSGARVALSCSGNECAVTSTIKCTGGFFNIEIACHGGNGKTPRAQGNATDASCYGDGGTFQEAGCNAEGGVTYRQGSY